MFQEPTSQAIRRLAIDDGGSAREPEGSLPVWRELPGTLLRRWAWIVGGVLATVLLAFLVVVLLPPTYRAGTEILVQPTDLKALDGAVSQASNQLDTSAPLLETAARVLTARKVLEPVVASLRLTGDPEFERAPSRLHDALDRLRRRLYPDAAMDTPDPTEKALEELGRHVTVRRSERTFVIDLSVRSKDAAKSARIANAIVASFIDAQATARTEAARRISDALTSRLAVLRDNLRRSEDAAQQFRVANNLLVANGQLVNEQQLAAASAQLLAAEQRAAEAKAKLDQVKETAGGQDLGAIPESLQSQAVTALRSQLAQSSRLEANNATVYGPRYPQLAQVRSEVAAARRALDGEIRRIRDAARGEYQRARLSEANVRTNLQSQQAGSEKTNAARIRLRELDREVDANRSLYEAFLLRARETAEQERLNTFNAWVISPAVAPAERSFPPSNQLMLTVALLGGLALGVAGALMREQLDPRLWTRGRVEAVTSLPVLAEVAVSRSSSMSSLRSARRGGEVGWSDHATQRGLDDGDAAALVRGLAGASVTAPGRIVLLLGSSEEDARLAARWLAAVAEAEGRPATFVRLEAAALEGVQRGWRGGRSSAGTAVGPLALPEPMQAWQVPDLIERLRALAAQLDGGLVIVAGRRGATALPQLATVADASVMVLARARSTRAEARSLTKRLASKAGSLRGSIFLSGAA